MKSDIRERFAAQALKPGNLNPDPFADYIKTAAGKWGKLIRETGITAK